MQPRSRIHLADGLPTDWIDQFVGLADRVRSMAVLGGAGVVCLLLAVGVAAGVSVDWLWDLGTPIRICFLMTIFSAAGVLIWIRVWRPWVREYSFAELAAVVERANPELRERLISAVELADESTPEAWKGSQLMREMLWRETAAKIKKVDFNASVSGTRAFNWATSALVAWFLLCLPLVFFPGTYGLLLNRFFAPWLNLDRVSNLYFEVVPGDTTIARGSDVTIRAQPRWRAIAGELPESIWLEWSSVSGADDAAAQTSRDTRRMDLDRTGEYVVTMPHVFRGFDFCLRSCGTRSRRFHIDVADAPTITAARLEIQPPSYTGRPATSIDGITGDIPVFDRSQLEVRLEFNKAIQSVSLEWLGDKGTRHESANSGAATHSKQSIPLKMSEDFKSATLKWTAELGGAFEFKLVDNYQLTNPSEPDRNLIVTFDQPPTLRLSGSEAPTDVRAKDVFSFVATATDDIGVAAMELQYQINGLREGQLLVPPERLGNPIVEYEFRWELASLNLKDGDAISYRVRAADERPVPGPQEVWSPPRVLSINSKAHVPGTSDLEMSQEELRQELQEIAEKNAATSKELGELYKAVDNAGRKGLKFNGENRLTDANERMEELAQQLEKLSAKLDEHPLMVNLSKETKSVADEELQAATEVMQAAQQEKDLGKKRNLVEKSQEQLNAAGKRLDEIGKRFDKQAELERELLELNRLADRTRELAQNAAAFDSRSIERQKQELSEQLGDLLKNNPELLKAAQQRELDRVAELSRQSKELARPQETLAADLNPNEKKSKDSANSDPSGAQNSDPSNKKSSATDAAEKKSDAAPAEKSSEKSAPDQKASSPAQRTNDEFRKRQEKLTKEAQKLAEGLEKAADKLESAPLDLKPAGEKTREALALAKEASQAMKEAEKQIKDGKKNEAAKSAQGACNCLKKAGDKAGAASQGKPGGSSDIPAKVSEKIGDALAKLQSQKEGAGKGSDGKGGEGKSDEQKKGSEKDGSTSRDGKSEGPSSKPEANGGQSQGTSKDLAAQLKQAADALSEAAQASQSSKGKSRGNSSSQSASAGGSSSPQGTGGNGNQSEMSSGVGELDAEVQKLTGRRWGELPGKLQTEILNAAAKRPNSDYARLIKLYFKEIAQTRRTGDQRDSETRGGPVHSTGGNK